MDLELAKFIGTLGVGGAIAGVLAVFYNRLAQSHEKNWVELTERWEKITEDMRLLIRENTISFTKALEMLSAMQKQIDRWDGVERRSRGRNVS